jgi:hypothetical protein
VRWLASLLAQMPQAPEPLPHPQIPSPAELVEGLPWWVYLAGVVLVLGIIALLVWLVVGGKKTVTVSIKRPVQTALRALKDLRSKAEGLTPVDIGHRVSEILRHYYEDRYHIPAPCRTSEELFPAIPLQEEHPRRRHWRERFESLAALYDALSYTPLPASKSEALALVETAINKLEDERLHEHTLAE